MKDRTELIQGTQEESQKVSRRASRWHAGKGLRRHMGIYQKRASEENQQIHGKGKDIKKVHVEKGRRYTKKKTKKVHGEENKRVNGKGIEKEEAMSNFHFLAPGV